MTNDERNDERDFQDGGGFIGGVWTTPDERNTNEGDEEEEAGS